MPYTVARYCVAIIVTGVLSIAGRAFAAACPPPARADAIRLQRLAARQHPDRGFLWEVSKDGQQFFLYGTVHVARLEWDFPGPVTTRTLEQASALAVELDLTSPDLAEKLRNAVPVQEAAVDTPTLAALERDIDEQARAACVDPARLRTSSLSTRIESLALLSARNAGLYPDYAIDAALVGFARAKGKPVVELENPEEQARALEDFPALQRNLERLVSGQAERTVKKLAFAWADSDRTALENVDDWCNCGSQVGGEASSLGRLVSERNAVLARRIQGFYEGHPRGFAAIGVLHLLGPGSVIEHLERAGYEVHPVWPASGH